LVGSRSLRGEHPLLAWEPPRACANFLVSEPASRIRGQRSHREYESSGAQGPPWPPQCSVQGGSGFSPKNLLTQQRADIPWNRLLVGEPRRPPCTSNPVSLRIALLRSQ